MHTDDLISGYLNLLTQFKIRTRTKTHLTELRLMFSLDEYDLVVFEEKTGRCIILATFTPQRQKWKHELIPGTSARKMIQYFCESRSYQNVPSALNRAFAL